MDIFAALADPVRRDLVRALANGPARVVELTRERGISRPAVSRHLRVLLESGAVTVEDHGRERHYALRPDAFTALFDYLADVVTPPIAEAALDALELEVRRTARDHRAHSVPSETSHSETAHHAGETA